MTTRTLKTPTLLLAALCFVACGEQETTDTSTAPVARSVHAQVSSGGGVAGYTFSVNGNKVGTLLVTSATVYETLDPALGYVPDREYWRWEVGALADLASGDLDFIDVSAVETAASWSEAIAGSPSLIDNFEATPTGETWDDWEINRSYDFQEGYEVVFNQPSSDKILFRMEAAGWAGFTTTVTYFLRMDFSGSAATPTMTWYMSWSDYQDWLNDPDYVSGDESIYEVRLDATHTEMEQTWVGAGYELKTVVTGE